MKMKSVVFLAVALGCGLVAMAGVHQHLNASNGEKKDLVQVLVATAEIPPGVRLDETNVVLRQWPKENVPEGAVTTTEEYEERALLSRAYPGEVILLAKLGDKGVFGAASSIPDGMRVVSIPVDATMTHSGLLQPHDRVDVMVTFKVRGERGSYVYRTRSVLPFVEVFATDSRLDNSRTEGAEEIKAKNVSLLVTPQQGALLKLAESKGTLHLALRSKTDTQESEEVVDVSDADFEQWLAEGEIIAVPNDEGSEEGSEPLEVADFLDQQQPEPVADVQPEPVQPKWSIEIFSGEEREVLEVIDDEPPQAELETVRTTGLGSASPLALLPGGAMLEPFRRWFGGDASAAGAIQRQPATTPPARQVH